jgi:hypothetical protein
MQEVEPSNNILMAELFYFNKDELHSSKSVLNQGNRKTQLTVDRRRPYSRPLPTTRFY